MKKREEEEEEKRTNERSREFKKKHAPVANGIFFSFPFRVWNIYITVINSCP